MNSDVVYPKSVKPGDTIGLVMPSSMIDQATLDKVLRAADNLGVKCKIGNTMSRAIRLFTAQQSGTIDQLWATLSVDEKVEYEHYIGSGYMAGSPRGRAEDINNFFADDEVQAIWCLRGGYSSSQIMPYLDYELIRSHPKQLLGYSDITNIINGIFRQTGVITYHAPMLAPNFTKSELLENGQVDGYTLSYFGQLIMSDWDEVELTNPTGISMQTMVSGQADGRIVGGNLLVLARAVGTPYLPQTDGKIVFLEEVKTHVVLCDMALTELEQAGFFANIRGLILGDFTECHNRTGYDKCQSWLVDRVLQNHFAGSPFPVISGVKIGHDKHTMTIPIGANCHMDADRQQIIVSRKS